ncbi:MULTISPECIES: hypothetical protein [Thermoactinomyces]|jgi:hypothetical protein|uniref:Uncharacterized protein n=1 Tax=Thermoactinomyces daqus TaxID=1329516 RepID=A0A7W1XD41_9BACL|nr:MULTISPECIES: hypothetical protein [Thermoactinomyces]MBA4544460.1 hypothetical protein [Thermoactinomyces daqus]MBH8599031.1 hypothetical protein [Thermoactinomyces sp. CICC 10523]MBH8605018.1 hypothetical protein [Thermoactinomyces sp. CICC 10522]MBH8608458.1 hypothetical protein [Thermoactinomyces sp. CICC 10521]
MKKNIPYLLGAPHASVPKIGIYTNDRPSTVKDDELYNKQAPFSFDNAVVSEEFTYFSVNLQKADQERYLNSFLKKKLLHIWKKQRPLILAVPKLPESLESAIYANVFQKIEPNLLPAYREDFSFPVIPFTLFGWLQYMKLIAQITGKHRDACYWEELTQFLQHCSREKLLDHLFSSN